MHGISPERTARSSAKVAAHNRIFPKMVLHVSVRVKSVLLVFMATAAVVAFFIIALANTKPSIRPVVLLTGDSHTQKGTNPAESGWVSLLQNQFVMTSDVITRGLPGYNTKWFSKFIAPSIKREIQAGVYNTPSLITVWFGSNDAALANGTSSKTHVSIEDFKENLKKVVRQFWTAAPAADHPTTRERRCEGRALCREKWDDRPHERHGQGICSRLCRSR